MDATNYRVNFWHSLSTRITAMVVVSSALVFILLASFTLQNQLHGNRELAQQELRTTGFLTQAALQRIMRYEEMPLIHEVMSELEVHRRVTKALLIDNNDRIYYSNIAGEIGKSLSDYNAGLAQAVGTLSPFHSDVVFNPNNDRFVGRFPIRGDVGADFRVEQWSLIIVYRSTSSLYSLIQQRWSTLLGELLLILLLASSLRWYLHLRLSVPLARLQAGVEHLKHSNDPVSIGLHDNDELGVLGRRIEAIAAERSAYFKDMVKLQTAIEQSNECVVITNVEGVIEYVNNAFTEVTGYSKAFLIGNTPRIFQSRMTNKRTYEELWHRLKAGKTWRGELLNKRADGSHFVVWSSITPVFNEQGKVSHYIGVEEDITERKADEERLHYLAYYDELTSLPNRLHLTKILEQILAVDAPNQFGSLLMVDLDGLQHINDARGYDFGSHLIQAVAERLKTELANHEHTLAHLGADTFAILLPDDSTLVEAAKHKANTVAQWLMLAIDKPFIIDNEELKVTTSIGCAVFPVEKTLTHQDNAANRTIRAAETAMHQAKSKGGNGIAFYKHQYAEQVQLKFETEKQLRAAINSGDQLRLFLQSQCHYGGKIVSAEALVRWQHPEQGLVSPGLFIPIAEQSELIIDLDRWMLRQVCLLLVELEQQGHHMSISINVSARHFRRSDFESWLQQQMIETGVNPELIVLEITEGVLLDDLTNVIGKMERLSKHGVQFAIDDFGTGYSSLAYLSRLPVNELKIDQSFVAGISNCEENKGNASRGVVQTIISVAQHMDMRIVAEGVETDEQAQFLATECPPIVLQGYLYSRPSPVNEWRSQLN